MSIYSYHLHQNLSSILNLNFKKLNSLSDQKLKTVPHHQLSDEYVNPFQGLKHTEETKRLMSRSRKNNKNYFGPKSKSHKQNISKAQQGIPWTEADRKSKTATCPHCGLTSIKANITRWHGDKCKHKH